MATFGSAARYDDEPWRDHRVGREEVRRYYAELLPALPDLSIDVLRRHIGSDAIVLDVVIRGTHMGEWRQLPGTGRKVEIPVTAVLDFVYQSLRANPVPIGDRRIRYQQNLGVRRINCPRAIPPPAPRAR